MTMAPPSTTLHVVGQLDHRFFNIVTFPVADGDTVLDMLGIYR